MGEGLAGWHGAPGGLVGAPVSLLHPLLYIDPSPRLPPLPFSLFKRYFHSRSFVQTIKADYLYWCVLDWRGTDTKSGGQGTPHNRGRLVPIGLQGRRGQEWQGWGQWVLRTSLFYPMMSQRVLSPYHIPSRDTLGDTGPVKGLSHPGGDPSSPPGIKRGHEQGATYFQNNRCIFIDALNAMTCFFYS